MGDWRVEAVRAKTTNDRPRLGCERKQESKKQPQLKFLHRNHQTETHLSLWGLLSKSMSHVPGLKNFVFCCCYFTASQRVEWQKGTVLAQHKCLSLCTSCFCLLWNLDSPSLTLSGCHWRTKTEFCLFLPGDARCHLGTVILPFVAVKGVKMNFCDVCWGTQLQLFPASPKSWLTAC